MEWIGQLKNSGGNGLDLAVILLVCLALEALILCVLFRGKKGLRAAAALLSFAFALAAFSLAFPDEPQPESVPAEPELLTEGDPAETAAAFFSAIRRGDEDAACACLSDYRTLTLNGEPEDEAARLMAQALRESRAFELLGTPRIDGLDASQRVSMTLLDLDALTADLAPAVEAGLQRLSREVPRSSLADADGHFLPEVTEKVFMLALQDALENREAYLRTAELELRLHYYEEGWLIEADRQLLDALDGKLPSGEGGRLS